MSEAATLPKVERLFETRAPFDLSSELRSRVEEHGVAETIAELRENGYGYVRQAAPPEFNARLREAILRISFKGVPPAERNGVAGASMCCTRIQSSRRSSSIRSSWRSPK